MGNGFGGLGFGGGFGVFSIFPVLFTIVFVLVLGVFITVAVKALGQWNKNNHSPRLTVDAKVVAKRTNYHRSSGSSTHMGHTTHYVTFEVASGDRMELSVQGSEYGLLVEGDFGELSFQGTRYLSFRRKAGSADDL